ncbi:MAG: hypothetical protein ACXQTZ_04925 [Candidatus Alkanophagales archaeon]
MAEAGARRKRPYYDNTESWCMCRNFYTAHVLGRPGDPYLETPVKPNMARWFQFQVEGPEEYVIRFIENQQIIRGWKGGIFKDISKVIAFLSFPPVFSTRIIQDPPSMILLYGRSVDTTFVGVDGRTLDMHRYFPDLHYEDGYVTNVWQFDFEFGMDLMERRHLKVGEKLKDLIWSRPAAEAGMLVRDVFLDVRNEMTPEYATSAYHICGWSVVCAGYESPSPTRIAIEISRQFYQALSSVKLGWPFKVWDAEFFPRPPALDLMAQNPPSVFTYRFNGLILGSNWASRYMHLPVYCTLDTFGAEIIPPTHEEIAYSVLRYGMDRYKMPETFVQSKWVYGDEARMMPTLCEETGYPLPARVFVTFDEATEIIKKAREEHPEWLLPEAY